MTLMSVCVNQGCFENSTERNNAADGCRICTPASSEEAQTHTTTVPRAEINSLELLTYLDRNERSKKCFDVKLKPHCSVFSSLPVLDETGSHQSRLMPAVESKMEVVRHWLLGPFLRL